MGLPAFTASIWANWSWRAAMPAAMRWSTAPRSTGGRWGQSPASKAWRAMRIAASTSTGPASATSASGAPVRVDQRLVLAAHGGHEATADEGFAMEGRQHGAHDAAVSSACIFS